MTDSPVILVTGGTGAIGPQIIRSCYGAGWRVRVFALDPCKQGSLPEDVEVILGDITDPLAVTRVMRGCEIVVHLAALLHIVNPPNELREKYERINVGGTATVVYAAIMAGVQRVVLASTIAVYGPSGGQVLDEESIPCPDTFYGQTKSAAEKIVLSAKRMDGQSLGTVLRFGAIYGSRVKGNYQRLVRALSRGWFIPVGNGSNRRTLVYDKDVARAVVLILRHPDAAGQVYNVTDGQFHTVKEINKAICTALGHKPPRLSIPIAPVRVAAGIVEDVSGLLGLQSPINRATIGKYIEDIAVNSQKIQTELGFVPFYPLQAGWQETIQELRNHGEL